MVIVCDQPYPSDSKYQSYFESYSFPLSDFQKYAIEAIIKEQHVLITAHTGSGKTLPAEFAINHFKKQGKKVIYTSPIKALSNQKYYEFTQKYPHISFGLFTGDIKTNPEADVLIMTTEILMNYLFTATTTASEDTMKPTLHFQIDIQNELGCVVFDEVHYINDADRGQTWEKTILMLPSHIQMVMLSATIDNPKGFAKWCEKGSDNKQVYLASTHHRVVPLTHYGYITTNESVFKHIKDKHTQQEIKQNTNKLILLQDEKGNFHDKGYKTIVDINELYKQNRLRMNRKHTLNQLAGFLHKRDMLPAIAFVFSRKNVESCANDITVPILEEDSKTPYIIRKECEQIVMRLPNYKEYLDLPEYTNLVSLLEKGVGIHHSGMIPILREIVEIMISKKHIRLLFATESFAIGLDCPIKTAIFTGLTKFDGNGQRSLHAHEYTQMAGRAGRRGIDTVGHIVHCNNLFPPPYLAEYKKIMNGKPQQLISKFHISYGLILNLLKNGQTNNFHQFAERSMINTEITGTIHLYKSDIEKLASEIKLKSDHADRARSPRQVCEMYIDIKSQLPKLTNKKRKDAERELKSIEDNYRDLHKDLPRINEIETMNKELNGLKTDLYSAESFIQTGTEKVTNIMLSNSFIEKDNDEFVLTNKGYMASNIAEVHPLVMSDLCDNWNFFYQFSAKQLVGLFSCFTDIKVLDDDKSFSANTDDYNLNSYINAAKDSFNQYADAENYEQINTGFDYYEPMNYDLIDLSMEWCECNNEEECRIFLQTRLLEKQISTGDFNKAMLKIVTISKELSTICEDIGKIDLLHKLNQIDKMVLKYVTTSQSLYL
jgi:superfamily II RNA helicase